MLATVLLIWVYFLVLVTVLYVVDYVIQEIRNTDKGR